MMWVFDDGGRKAAGYKGDVGDCVCRSIAIARQRPYQEVYDELNQEARRERPGKRRGRSNARNGMRTATIKRYLERKGWLWTATMGIGTGCTVHVREELPEGRLILNLSKHVTAVIDGVIHDTYDPSRGGTRCVYGYWWAGPEAV